MTLLDALAAALRDRLLAGHAASLPGVGTLRRARVAARVEPQPDGSSLLLPPSESVAFEPGAGAADAALADRLLNALGTPGADAAATLQQAIDQLEGHLAASGTAQLPGVGAMQRTPSGTAFEPDPGLLAAVAQPYEGMAPVSAQPSTAKPAPTDASFIDETTLDDDLDDVLAVPFGTSDPGGLRATLPLTPEDKDPSVPNEPAPDDAPTVSPAASGTTLAASSLVDADETDAWAATPAREPDPTPPSEAPPSAPPDELASAPVAPGSTSPTAPTEPAATPPPVESEPSDLDWLAEFDGGDEAAVAASSVAAGSAPEASVPAPEATAPVSVNPVDPPPHLPKPPPVIAGRREVPEPARRGIPVWVWLLVPLLVLAGLFAWTRMQQDPSPSEPIATAELAPEPDRPSASAPDTLSADGAAADSTAQVADASSTPDTTAASPLGDAAALDGEFPVEELGAGGAAAASSRPSGSSSASSSAGRAAPATARTADARPASPTGASQPVDIDEPEVDALPRADREALTGTAPIVSGRGGYSWVVLSTRDRTPADLRARQYRDAGWRVRVFETEALGDTVYRLAIGQFSTREQAERLREHLPSQVPVDTWLLDLSTL